jgi:hypothetical protein
MTTVDESSENRLIDRLVDGDIASNERRELLLRLERQTDGWRSCALAFLEAQEWKAAIAATTKNAFASTSEGKPRRTHSRWLPFLSLAALVLLACGVGWMSRYLVEPTRTIVASPRIPESATVRHPAIMPAMDIRPTSMPATSAAPTIRPPSYVRGRLAREGYQVQHRLFLLPAKTPNGRSVSIPVGQIQVRYVGTRTI